MIAQGSLVLVKQSRTVLRFKLADGNGKESQKWCGAIAIASSPDNSEGIFAVLQCMLVGLYSPHQLRVLWFEKLATAIV